MFQSNIYYYASIKGVLCISGKDVPTKVWISVNEIKILVHAQHSCACTTFFCMHWRGQGPRLGPKKSPGGPAWASTLFGSRPWSLAPPVHAQECCACTRVLCMHKNLVHAHEYYYIIRLWYHYIIKLLDYQIIILIFYCNIIILLYHYIFV